MFWLRFDHDCLAKEVFFSCVFLFFLIEFSVKTVQHSAGSIEVSLN